MQVRRVLFILAIFAISANVTFAGTRIYVKTAPPSPKVVVVKPTGRAKNMVWINGHWQWNGKRYVWIDGHWEKVRKGYLWVEGHWHKSPQGYYWVDGHWKKR